MGWACSYYTTCFTSCKLKCAQTISTEIHPVKLSMLEELGSTDLLPSSLLGMTTRFSSASKVSSQGEKGRQNKSLLQLDSSLMFSNSFLSQKTYYLHILSGSLASKLSLWRRETNGFCCLCCSPCPAITPASTLERASSIVWMNRL